MKQNPNNLKYRKNHKPGSSYMKLLSPNFYPVNGNFGLKSLESGRLNYKQIEAGRKSLKRSIRRKGKLWIKPFTYVSLTKKGLGVRMGTGKGNHSTWICPIRTGKIIYEIIGLNDEKSIRALRKVEGKLPIHTKIVKLMY